MAPVFASFFRQLYPQNHLIKHPVKGGLVLGLFCFLFLVVYKPMDIHPRNGFSMEINMAIYALTLVIPYWMLVKALKRIPWFRSPVEWTAGKEVSAIGLLLTGLGIFVYFAGFAVEGPSGRWNLETFFDSCKITLLTGFIPFGFYSAVNFRHRGIIDVHTNPTEKDEAFLQIKSQLKKESFTLNLSRFLYAVSEGNYVIFYFLSDSGVEKQMVRNSMQDISNQLAGIPHVVQTHRAYIVNLNKVRDKRGNAAGYRLTVEQVSEEIPVSRSRVEAFERFSSEK